MTFDEVMPHFTHIHPLAQQIITHGVDWKLWVLCDREPTDQWVDGRATILGDAAHPMMQYLAQGACMAMEDAVCVTQMLADHPGNVEAALTAYANLRMLRTARVQLTARAVGDNIYHPSGVHAELRNAIMRAKSSEEWYEVMAWLYDGTGLNPGILAK